MKHRLQALAVEGGAEAVRAHLAEEASSRAAAFRNSWQTAMYSALASDEQFCAGRFHEI